MNVQNLQRDFFNLLSKNKFITYREYNRLLKKYDSLFLNDKDDYVINYIANNGYLRIEKHNEEIIKQKLIEEKDYFDNMFKDIDSNIVLDEEQRKAILNEEDYSLIIAGAGAGKTTTMASKVKYLVERCGVHPSRIAVISYTNKATEELEDRIKYEFNLPVDIMTFHSLGIKLIRKMFKNPLKPLAEKEQKEIIINYVSDVLFKDKDLLEQYVDTFNNYEFLGKKMFAKGFVDNYKKFETFSDYFIDYKKRKLELNKDNLEDVVMYRIDRYLKAPMPRTIRNEVMRSKAEALIANFLFMNGIDYKYEEPYPEKVDEEKTYLPDFTIEVNGIPLYIEYFGLSSFYVNGSISEKDKKKYNDLRLKKRSFHKLNKNNYIELDYKKNADGEEVSFLDDLEKQLKDKGVLFHKLSWEEIYNQILDNNLGAEFYNFINFMLNIINSVKGNINRENIKNIIQDYIYKDAQGNDKNEMIREANLFIKIYNYYEKELLPKNRIDFSDMIYYANKYMKDLAENENILDYDYLIVDEYQDISIDRYQFARNISLLSKAKVTSVGDDWQTIFSFAGSRIDLFLKYNMLFPGAQQLFINSTYRSSQQLIDCAGNFIMKNPLQIKKQLISNKSRNNPLKFCFYDKNQFEMVRYIVNRIYKENPNDRILILARKNKHITNMLEMPYFKEGVGTRVICEDCPMAIIDAMSVHSSKGLGADQVILLNVTNKDFPCLEVNNIWLSNIFKPKGFDEKYPYAEDRRIFYVALTRTKNDVYLLVPSKVEDRSPFLDELG